MAADSLTSDHVNYLIWRYLQETGHGEAAVKLQRDWMLDPQSLPFADNVRSHALISLVQKGLQYHEIERSLKDSRSQLHASATALFFGTTAGRSKLSPTQDDFDDETKTAVRKSRKHDRNHAANGLSLDMPTPAPAAKRHRRTNLAEASTNGDPMQIDQNGYHDRVETASPINNESSADDGTAANGMEIDDADAEAPATPTPEPLRTITNGQSIGIQSEKSVDLTSNTTVKTLSSPSQTVMHIAWNPQDPTILATAGEALCRIWNITKAASLSEPYRDILMPTDDSLVSTMAWSPSGDVLAVATRNAQSSDWVGAVSLWTKQGISIEELPATQEMVIMLRWNAAGTRLLGITSSGERSSSVIVWDVSSSETVSPCQVDGELRDATWLDDNRFVVCGRGLLAISYSPAPNGITLEYINHDETIVSKTWTHIRFDPDTASIVCAAEDDGLLARVCSTPGNPEIKVKADAHSEQITALELQPVVTPTPRTPEYIGRISATTSLDGTTKIWASATLDCINVLSIGSNTPATSLNFSRDGHLLAAASQSRILIWSPAEHGPPKAIWKGDLGRFDGTLGNKKAALLTNGNGNLAANNERPAPDRDSAVGDVAEEDGSPSCSLSWDRDGTKLALGVSNQIAIVDFKP